MNSQTPTNVPVISTHIAVNIPALSIDLSAIPALLDVEGINAHLAPISKTLLYELASSGDIETASIGLRRGRRVFVTLSVVQWLQKRMAATKRPRMADRRASAKADAAEEK